MDKKSRETVALKKIFDAFQNATDAQVALNSRPLRLMAGSCDSHSPQPLTRVVCAALQRTFREIMFLQQLTNHENIIRYGGCCLL